MTISILIRSFINKENSVIKKIKIKMNNNIKKRNLILKYRNITNLS